MRPFFVRACGGRAVLGAVLALTLSAAMVGISAPAYAFSGTYQGTVTDESLVPIDGAEVTAYDPYFGVTLGTTTTDGYGHYSLTLGYGAVRLRFRDPSGDHATRFHSNSVTWAGSSVVPGSDGGSVTVDQSLPTIIDSIAGTVRNQSSTPLSGITVTVFDPVWGVNLASTTTDGSGGYAVQIADGNYRVMFTDPGGTYATRFHANSTTWSGSSVVTVAAPGTTTVDATLPLALTTVTGRVTHSGGGLANVRVEATQANGPVVAATNTDGSGNYTLPGLNPGRYQVRFTHATKTYATTWYGGTMFQPLATVLTLAGGSATADQDLDLAGSVSGRVVAGTTQPLQNMAVYVLHPGALVPAALGGTDANGNFSIKGLKPGTYKIGFLDINLYYGDPVTAYRAELLGNHDYAVEGAAGFAASPAQTITSGTNTPVGTTGLAGYHCDPTVFTDGADLTGHDLRDANLKGCAMVNENLTGANFNGADLQDADLMGSDLSGADVTGAFVQRARFADTDLDVVGINAANGLTSAIIAGADLTGAGLNWMGEALVVRNFSDTDFGETNLTGAVVYGSNFNGADLQDVTGAGTMTGFNTISAVGANVSNANLSGSYLAGFDLAGATLIGTNLSSANLAGAQLDGADLTNADLSGADLTGADLTGADLTGANLVNADLTDADLNGADLTNADLTGATLTNLDLTNATITGATFLTTVDLDTVTGLLSTLAHSWAGVTLDGVDLSGADLSGASMPGAYLHGTFDNADLSDAQLAGVSLSGSFVDADLTGIDLSGGSLVSPVGGPDVSGADLTGAVITVGGGEFVGADLTDATLTVTGGGDFTNATMLRVEIDHSSFSFATFQGANLREATIRNTPIAHTSFALADLTDALLYGVSITGASLFAGATLDGADFRVSAPGGLNLSGASARGTDFSFVSLGVTNIMNVDFTNAIGLNAPWVFQSRAFWQGANFTGTGLDLTGANLSGRNFTGTTFAGLSLSGADLTNTNLTNANLTGATLIGTDLTGTNLTGANFTNANLLSATVTGATLTGANFTNASGVNDITGLAGTCNSWAGANFSATNLSYIDLSACHLVGVNFSATSLFGATLLGADLTNADLTNANLTAANLQFTAIGGATFTTAAVSNANFGGATGLPAIVPALYSDTRCPDFVLVSSPTTCSGHGW